MDLRNTLRPRRRQQASRINEQEESDDKQRDIRHQHVGDMHTLCGDFTFKQLKHLQCQTDMCHFAQAQHAI